ncbi:C4-dicarboxylate ABC transporter substrate-binding protein [Hahella sp. CCB-MM4]|uniref:TRAP transporter substrate-binding protein n=1 Tax=Hahella sp. (strain CCB-MM4) TaxID=1926491 RepID=UPI000B9B252F|nr:TRAP transporter substrate-binding protein [Hahella sp. CCB-MM4]OZG71896.1 C4-dicarboxylate ABC transporter substrate-binding protein [Hahella sp. CCB-MM4]
MKNKMFYKIAGAIFAIFALGTAQADEWDMPTPYPDKTFHTQNIIQFAKDVEESTKGELKIKVHTAGSLFKHADIKNAVRGGQVPIGEFFLSLLSNENPVFGVDSQPFLATSYEDADKLWHAQKDVVSKLLDKQGLMILYSVPWPPQGLYVRKEISSVDDLKGVKFRAYNATLERLASQIGAAPTQVEVPDIPQAFATGHVEAMITSPSTGANSKAWDFVNHYYDIRAWLPKNVVVVNKRAFRRLDKSVQEAVLQAAAAAEKRGWEMSRQETTEQTKVLADNGMAVHEPTSSMLKEFQALGNQMIDYWVSEAGPEGREILNQYNAK